MAEAYGHKQVLERRYGRRDGKLVPFDYPIGVEIIEGGSPHYKDEFRWQFGLGPFGQNTALWVHSWDVNAPPEILCQEVPAIELYLRRARRVVADYQHGIDCGGVKYHGMSIKILENGQEVVVEQPSWVDIHRATSGGKYCPRKSKKASFYNKKLRGRLKSVGIRPDEPVTADMLGEPIPKDIQNERAMELLSILEEKLPPPFH